MGEKQSKNNPYIPTEAREKLGIEGTNNITEGKDTGSWWNQPDVDEKIDDYVEKELANTKDEFTGLKKEPLEGQRGSAKGNQGDNNIANPDAPDTADITKKHNEELAQLQNAIGDTNVATGTIPNEPLVTEEAKVEEESADGDGKKPDGGDTGGGDKGDGSEDTTLPKAPEEGNLDFSDYISNFYGPKNGADYLKALWTRGEYGKAVGNVLGNLLGSLGAINVGGASTGGIGSRSDWEDYRNNYTKAMAERNQQAFDQNMDISKQLRTNDVARNEMLKTLENYQKIGKGLDPEKFENIRKALTATGKGSQIDYYLASALGELSSDPAFMEAAKEAGGNAVELLGNLAQFSGNTLRPINWFFGQAGNTMNNMFGGK
jgi:hypothetical protein